MLLLLRLLLVKVLGCCLLELLCESFKWVPHVASVVVVVTIVVSVVISITSVVVTSISSVIRVVSIPIVDVVVVVAVAVAVVIGFSGSRSGLPWFSCTTMDGLEHVAKAGDKMHPLFFNIC